MDGDEEYERLINIGDQEQLSPVWSTETLKKFASGLEAYLSILKPKAKEGADKINNEVQIVQSILAEVKKAISQQGRNKPLPLEAAAYKLLNDIMWKQWAILGQIYKTKSASPTIEGELEPEENQLEELRQLLDQPFFQKIPRRKTLVSDLSEYYMKPEDNGDAPRKITLTKDWFIGKEFDGDNGGFGKIFNAHGEDEQEVVAKFVPMEPGADRELLFVNPEGVRNVIPILDSGESGSDLVIIMPKAEKSLRKHIQDADEFTLENASLILKDVLETLEDLEGKIVHRDIKPENILFLNGKWCLADFGISKYSEATTSTNTHKFAMSAPYAAPERWRSQRATTATDIYSLGIVAYELVGSPRPFNGPSMDDYSEQHISERPARISGVPSPFADLIDETLYKPQESRPRPSNMQARLSSITEPNHGIVIEALQEANSAEVDRRAQREVERSSAQTALERRGLLQDAAVQSLEKISTTLRDAITASAPSAELAHGANVTWFIRMNYATLEFTPITTSIVTDWEYAEPPDIEVMATVDLILKTSKPNYGKEGRSHSLWYCDAKEKGQFEWFEVGFMLSPLYQKSTSMEPFALDPGRDAALALTPITAHVQVGWPFTPLKDENLTEFVQRWGTWFAVTSQNGYQSPGQMPERDTSGSWRR